MELVFSEKAFVALLAETKEYNPIETGGIFLGHRNGDIWYVIEMVDPGYHATRRQAFFEYDTEYINHLMNVVDSRYKNRLEVLGLWHRHPGSFDSFSATDDETNLDFASKHESGAVSALVNIDPVFRLTVYHVKAPLSYTKIKYKVGNKHIPQSYLKYSDINELVRSINVPDSKSDVQAIQCADNKKKKDFCFFKKLIDGTKRVVIRKTARPSDIADDDLEYILSELGRDIDSLQNSGRTIKMSMEKNGALKLVIENPETDQKQILAFRKMGDKIYFKTNSATYEYQKNMFSAALL